MNPYSQSEYLGILTHAPADEVKALAESVLAALGEISVLKNRTGLVMLPYTDSAGGAIFHLGEVLVSEAHIKLTDGTQGFALVTGRDLVFALGIAVLDAALQMQTHHIDTITEFLDKQAAQQQSDDDRLLLQVEATRVEMETF